MGWEEFPNPEDDTWENEDKLKPHQTLIDAFLKKEREEMEAALERAKRKGEKANKRTMKQ